MKSAILASTALALATFGLSACGDEAATTEEIDPTAMEGISVTDGRLVLPAVKGNPGAVYFTVQNDGDRDRFIRSAVVKGAKTALIHQMNKSAPGTTMDELPQIAVPKAGPLVFKPGDLHVMAINLDETLVAGGTSEVALTFAGGKKVTFPVQILAAGDER